MSTSTKEAELRERILDRRLPTSVERVRFFPDCDLRQVLTYDVVAEVIVESNIPIHDRRGVIKDILEGAQKIFCILVCIRHVNYMNLLLRSGIGDAKLALSKEGLVSSGLPIPAAEEFWHQQWDFIAPIFKSRVQKLDPSCIIPFKEEQDLGEGGYGAVSKVVLYRSHQDLVPGGPGDTVVVARKRIKRPRALSRAEAYFESERGPLELLKAQGHPHIIKLLGSYYQNDDYNLFFPLAEGSLKDLFDGGRSGLDVGTESFYSSIVGLSSAINHIHNFTYKIGGKNMSFKGYHHDLKPDNILIQQGKFVIADFGLSKFKPHANTSSTIHKTGTVAYLPPEACGPDPEANFDDRMVGRSVDIWAFGCILTEIATYLLRGSEGVREFGGRRLTKISANVRDDSFHAYGEVKEEVREWLKSLEIMVERGSQISRLIQIVWKILIPDRKNRPTAQAVLEEVSLLDPETATNMELFVSQGRTALPPSPPISPAGSPQSRPQTTLPGSGTLSVLSEGTRDLGLRIDVVALHGLNGDLYTCWQGGDGSIWLRDFLPSDGMHLPRILSYGYDSERLFTHLSKHNLEKEAHNFLRQIQQMREIQGASTRPIIFLAHSVGGFLLKQAILLAKGSDEYRDLFKSICGVTFFGTPHREHGIFHTMSACLHRIATTASVSEQSRELLRQNMCDNDQLFKTVNHLFKTMICTPRNNLRVVNFYETKPTPGLGVVVDKDAGTMGLNGEDEKTYGLELSHPDLCRYSSETEPSYKVVLRGVRLLTRISADEYGSKQAKELEQEVPYINNHQQFSPEIYVNNILPHLPIIPLLQQPSTASRSIQNSNMTLLQQPTTTPKTAPRTQTKPSPPPSHTPAKKKQTPPPPQSQPQPQARGHTAPLPQPPKKSQTTQSKNSINAIEERLAKVGRRIGSIAADIAARQKERKVLRLRRQERGEQWFSDETRKLDKRITELEARRTEAHNERERLKLELIGARTVHSHQTA
ncbi:kinase-like domain-containing protein [Tuber brumale]|nr:kinase-like domain-containing protein [Tuber brumale]